MSCEACYDLMDTPEELLEPWEAGQLHAHLQQCGRCRALADGVEETLQRYRSLPPRPPPPHLLAALDARIVADSPPELRRRGPELVLVPSWRERGVLVPWAGGMVAAAAALLMVWSQVPRALPDEKASDARHTEVQPLPVQDPGRSSVRLKGSGEAPLELDLQALIERLDPHQQPWLERAEEGAVLEARDGLIFRFSVDGGTQLLLIERDPHHRLKVVYERVDLARDEGPQTLEITSPVGAPLRYVPDGPPGEYTFLAVALRERQPMGSGTLDALWSRYVELLLNPPQEAPGDLILEALRLEVRRDGTGPPSSAGASP